MEHSTSAIVGQREEGEGGVVGNGGRVGRGEMHIKMEGCGNTKGDYSGAVEFSREARRDTVRETL